MNVTYHATQRFLERVLNKVKYTKEEFNDTKKQLEYIFKNIVPSSYARPFALPGYKGFKVVHQENIVITILEKNMLRKGKYNA